MLAVRRMWSYLTQRPWGAKELRRVRDQPGGQERLIAEADGIDYVIVNGTILRKHNENQLSEEDELPGKLLRGGRARS